MDLSGFVTKSHRQLMKEFIELYRSLPALWKSNSPLYKNREAKQEAYNRLLALLQQVNPKIDLPTVKRKINSLRTTFRRERRRVAAKHKKGDPNCAPTLWYYDMMLFTLENEGKPSKKNKKKKKRGGYESEEDYYDVETLEDDYNAYTDEENRPDGLANLTEIKVKSVRSLSTSYNEKHNKSKIKKRRSSDSGNDYDDGHPTTSKPSVPQSVNEVFGGYVAMELSKLDDEKAKFCRKMINEALFEAQMGSLNYYSKIVTPQVLHESAPTKVFIEVEEHEQIQEEPEQ